MEKAKSNFDTCTTMQVSPYLGHRDRKASECAHDPEP